MGGRGASRGSTASTPSGKTLRDFQKMDALAEGRFFEQLEEMDLPEGLNDSNLQTFMYGLGLNSKPNIVSEDEFDKLVESGAEPLYRSVPEDEYQDLMMDSDVTWVGKGTFGGGLYFANDLEDSRHYGGSTVAAVLNKNAKIVDIEEINRQSSINVGRAGKAERSYQASKQTDNAASALEAGWWYAGDQSLTALKSGYNVVRVKNIDNTGHDYYVVLDRSALTMSRKRY